MGAAWPGRPVPVQIRDAVTKALAERETKAAAGGAEAPVRSIFVPPAPGERVVKNPRVKAAWLFGSYARGDATARSDLDIMVIVEEMPRDWPSETVDLTSAIHEALGEGFNKGIDLLLADEATFEDYKKACNSVYHDVHKEGIPTCLNSSESWRTSTATSSPWTPPCPAPRYGLRCDFMYWGFARRGAFSARRCASG